MRFRLVVTLSLAFAMCQAPQAVLAHHSSAAFDTEHSATLSGAVTAFEWSNPHVFIYLDVKDQQGAVEQWRVEANSPNMLTRAGWKRDMIQPGDQLKIVGSPAKNGTKVMRLVSVTLQNGQEYDGQGFR